MDPSRTLDADLPALLEQVLTPEELNRLIHYALSKLKQKRWRGVWNGKVPGGVEARDLAMAAIEAVLIGDPKEGGRAWDRKKQPDLLKFLRGVVDSYVSRMANSAENRYEREPAPAGGESDADFIDRNRESRFDPDAAEATGDDEAVNETLYFALLDEAKDDRLVQRILECNWDGVFGRAEVAQKLGVDVKEVTSAKKRLERMLPDFRKKYAHLNKYKS